MSGFIKIETNAVIQFPPKPFTCSLDSRLTSESFGFIRHLLNPLEPYRFTVKPLRVLFSTSSLALRSH